MYDLIMFDLDGTLTLPEEGITKSVQYALSHFGIEENDMERLRRFIGPPLVDAFMGFYGMSRENALDAVKKYRERFSVKGLFENELIDGIPQMLDNLRKGGKKLALATSKPIVFAQKIIDYYDITKYFDVVVGAEFDGTRNEKEDVIAEVLRQVPDVVSPVMVGDRMHDVIGAKKNNVPCIGVLYGYAAKGELEENGAVCVVGSVSELRNILIK